MSETTEEKKARAAELLNELSTVSPNGHTASIIMILESLGDRLVLIEKALNRLNDRMP